MNVCSKFRIIVLLLAFLAPCSPALAGWPERTVKMIVTFPPGSANDAAARIFAEALSRRWNKPVIVEDRAGAEGTLGVGSFVATQDDHTLLYTVAGSITVAPLLVDKLPYDADQDLQPIASTTAIVLTLAVSNGIGARTIPELIDLIRAAPGQFAWTSGPTLPRYVFAAFLRRHGLSMNYLSYRDAAQPQVDLGENRIQVLVTSMTASSAPVQSGKARYLGVINSVRSAALPDVKTVRELGYPELEIDGLAGVFGSKAMSEELKQQIGSEIAAVCADAEVRRKLEAGGHNVLAGTTKELKEGIAVQRAWIAEINRFVDIREAR